MLLYRPKMFEDECLLGYLTRVSEAHSFKHYGHLLNYLGQNWKNNRAPIKEILNGKSDISELVTKAGLDWRDSALKAIFDSQQKGTSTSAILACYPRICPYCIDENGYIRESWALLPVTVCTRHLIPLIDRVSADTERLSWMRNNLLPGGVQFSLPTGYDRSLVRISVFFESTLYESCCYLGPALLDGLTPSETLTVLHFIMYVEDKADGTKRHNLRQIPLLSLQEKYVRAFKVIEDWPASFFKLLDRFKTQPQQNRGNSGIRKYYRDIYDRLYKSRNYPGLDRLFEAFQVFVEKSPELLRDSSRFKRLEVGSQATSSMLKITDAARLLGYRLPRIRRLVECGNFEVVTKDGYDYITSESLINYQQILDDSFTFKDLCDALDLNRSQVLILLRSDHFKVYQSASDAGRDWLVSKTSVKEKIANLVECHIEPNNLSKRYTFEGFFRQGNSIDQIVNGIESKRIRCHYSRNSVNPLSIRQFGEFQRGL